MRREPVFTGTGRPRTRSLGVTQRHRSPVSAGVTRGEEECMTVATTEPTLTDHEVAQVERANASRATPVVFVHGLWLLPSSWDRWVTLFEERGPMLIVSADSDQTVPWAISNAA